MTHPFTTTAGDYLGVLLSLWLPRYGWLLLLPIAACAAVGVVIDERFLFIALMLAFIVVPMLMSFLYPYYMLAPEARRSVLRKRVEVVEGKHLRLVYLPAETAPATPALLPDPAVARPAPVAERVPDPEVIGWERVRAVRRTSRFRVYVLDGPRLNFILIPHSAFAL